MSVKYLLNCINAFLFSLNEKGQKEKTIFKKNY